MTTAYDAQRDAISRTPQFLVKIGMTSCDNNYASALAPSTCAAVDAGDGKRCWYSKPTCQDAANFRINSSGIKLFRFCLKNAPIPLGSLEVYPMIKSVDFTPQAIDPERAVTVNERVKIVFYDDAATWIWNQDKLSGGALVNDGIPSGSFWRRFMKIYRNYANPRNYCVVFVGFAGLALGDFQQRGNYLIDNITIGGDGLVTVECVDRLKLTKSRTTNKGAVAPAKISDSNLINGAINNSTTSLTVDDYTEITAPGTGYTVTLELDYDNPGSQEFVNVTVPGAPMTIQRGRWGTSAKSHADNAKFREVLMMGTENTTPANPPFGKNPIDCVIELLQRGGIAASDIDTTTLNSERDTWVNGSVTANVESGILFKRCGNNMDLGNGGISIQTDIETLLKQIREPIMLDVWVGEDQIITGHVFAPARPSVTLTSLNDANNLVKGSIEVDDNEESRITRVVVGFNWISGDGSSLSHYGNILVRADPDAEGVASYGAIRTKLILSQWIKAGDFSTASKLATHILGRFREPARRVSVALELKDEGVKTGDFVQLTTARIQKPDGTSDPSRIMAVLRKQRKDDGTIQYEMQDTGLVRRYAFIAPAGYPNYDSASDAQKRYGFIGKAGTNTVGAAAEPGYYIW